jgi:hypothetical protein
MREGSTAKAPRNRGELCRTSRGKSSRGLVAGDHRFTLCAQAPRVSWLLTAMGNVFPKSLARDSCSRSRRRAYGDVRHSLRVLRPEPRPAASPSFQRDPTSNCAVDCPTGSRSLYVRSAGPFSDSRHCQDLRDEISQSGRWAWTQADTHSLSVSMAERIRRKMDWQPTKRLPGPCNCDQ